MVYPSKKDWWLVLPVLPGAAAMLAGGIVLVSLAVVQAAPLEALFPGMVLLGVGLLILWTFSSTSYEVTDTTLVVRCGPFRKSLPLDAIAEITPKKGFSPECGWNFALSMDRLSIRYRKPNGRIALLSVTVSPKDQTAFLREIAQALQELN